MANPLLTWVTALAVALCSGCANVAPIDGSAVARVARAGDTEAGRQHRNFAATADTGIEGKECPGLALCFKSPEELFGAHKSACIGVKYNTNNYGLYSENYVEAYVHECGTTKPLIAESVQVGHRYRGAGERFSSKACQQASSCSFSERNYGNAKSIECALGAMVDKQLGSGSVSAPDGHVCGP